MRYQRTFAALLTALASPRGSESTCIGSGTDLATGSFRGTADFFTEAGGCGGWDATPLRCGAL